MPKKTKGKKSKSKTKPTKKRTKRRGNKYKSKFHVKLKKSKNTEINNVTFWMALIVLLVSNLVISIVLIPFLIVLPTVPLLMIIILFGIMFGSLFKIVLDSIGNIEKKHHYIATFFIPSLAIVNITVITILTNEMIQFLKANSTHNPIILGLTYALAFISPFIYKSIKQKLGL